MFFKPRPPQHIQLRTGLQDRRNLAAGPATYDTGMTSMGLGKDLDNRRRFAVAARGQKYAVIAPVQMGPVPFAVPI